MLWLVGPTSVPREAASLGKSGGESVVTASILGDVQGPQPVYLGSGFESVRGAQLACLMCSHVSGGRWLSHWQGSARRERHTSSTLSTPYQCY